MPGWLPSRHSFAAAETRPVGSERRGGESIRTGVLQKFLDALMNPIAVRGRAVLRIELEYPAIRRAQGWIEQSQNTIEVERHLFVERPPLCARIELIVVPRQREPPLERVRRG